MVRMSLLSPHQGEIRGSPMGQDARAESRWPCSMGLSPSVSRRAHARDSQASRFNTLTQSEMTTYYLLIGFGRHFGTCSTALV